MTTSAKSSRPNPAKAEATKINSDGVDRFSLTDLDALAVEVDGAFVIIVETPAGRYRRRVYLTAKAAEKAANRAGGRGLNCRVYLAKLLPVHTVVASTVTLPGVVA